jgi:phenylacetate-coenzyme A ligase PaaK-like adenylate-forming protein
MKGLIAYGMDTGIYRQQLKYYWGKEPLEIYAATESGTIATQAWNKKHMTCIPFSSFREFIPEEEWQKNRNDENYQPSTVLMDELEPGKIYEVVVTSFYGMPFLRYRIGDLIRVIAMEDKEAGIKLPQIAFESRADGIIDLGSFARLDEKTVWQAIADTGLKYEDWSARKEYEKDHAVVRIYIELKEDVEAKDLEQMIHRNLTSADQSYQDMETMLGLMPVRVEVLPAGSFQRYYEKQLQAGADLAHLKPAHMNAPDAVIETLVNLGQSLGVE